MKIAITGTTSGIGEATKALCIKQGHSVTDINRTQWDLHDLDRLKDIDLSHHDVLINNAGHNLGHNKFTDAEHDNWMNVMKANQLAPMLLTKRFMEHNQAGTVIFMTTHHDSGSIHGGAYHTAKAGLKYFINIMREETKQYRFVDVSIGRVKTKMRENMKVDLTNTQSNYGEGNHIEATDVAKQVLHVIDNEHVHEIYVKHIRR